MKQKRYTFIIMGALVALTLLTNACVDQIKFGNAFLDKASGNSVTKDTVFASAAYTQQFLTGVYARQFYGLPFNNKGEGTTANSQDLYTGKNEAMTDLCHDNWSSSSHYGSYYNGTLTANYSFRGVMFHYNDEFVWEAVRAALILIENIDDVPDLETSERNRMVAEAKCLIAARYYDMFRYYGGLPLLYESFSGSESSYDFPRATVEETVDYMVNLLDEAIATSDSEFPWAYDGSTTSTSTTWLGRWTKAGAMALKCKILLFAASPLFNDTQGYYGGTTEAEQQQLVWLGGYSSSMWTRCYTACKEFFDAVSSKGYYKLYQPQDASDTTGGQYRWAYRMGYITSTSPEVLHFVRFISTDAWKSGTYSWRTWQTDAVEAGTSGTSNVERLNYSPTEEYIEMFPWADGTPFDWDTAEQEGKLDEMFYTGDIDPESNIQNYVCTRDPRLYETARLNGQPAVLDWSTGAMSGYPYEIYVGGANAGNDQVNQANLYGTGYANAKYVCGTEFQRQEAIYTYLRLSDLMLTYAEAIAQSGGSLTEALSWVNQVRARVGLCGLEEAYPSENLASNKDNFITRLLEERARELFMEDSRWFDLVRYKMQDKLQTQTHGLIIYRQEVLDSDGNVLRGADAEGGEYQDYQQSWYNMKEYATMEQPTHFRYEKYPISMPVRYWWKYGFDPKWYLTPFPQTEINKGYGLVQNPGW